MNKIQGIKNYLGVILTSVIIVALVVYSFVGIGVKDAIDKEFWVSFAVNFGIMLLITSIWYPEAKRKAQYSDAVYLAQRKRYGELVDKVILTNNQRNLAKFCEYATEENRKAKIKQALININVDYDVYLKYLKEPFALKDDTTLSAKQKKKLLALIENGVKVKKISHSKIITGIKSSRLVYETTSEEQRYDVAKIVTKMIVSVVSSVFMAYMVFSLFGFSWASVAQLFTWLILICWNIFTSYQAGYKSISVKRADYYKKLKTFLEEFVSSEYFSGDKAVSVVLEKNIAETVDEK